MRPDSASARRAALNFELYNLFFSAEKIEFAQVREIPIIEKFIIAFRTIIKKNFKIFFYEFFGEKFNFSKFLFKDCT